MNELKTLLKFRRRDPHVAKLKTLMEQLEREIGETDNVEQLNQRFRDANAALVSSKRQLQESRLPDSRNLANELDALARALTDIEDSPQKAACDIVLSVVKKVSAGVEGRGEAITRQKQKVLAEMKAVQARIGVLRTAKKAAKPQKAHEIEAEIDALTEQQTELIESLTRLTSHT
jgi:hypothetical protein